MEEAETWELLSFVFEITGAQEEEIIEHLYLSCLKFYADQEFNVYPLELGRNLFKILPMGNFHRDIIESLE